ncbi:glycoside hydrolase family 71/99-like protein [Pseudochryseolinea flava]|uniref:Endo-alpha-mannosidase n=1 Tax=Pseudochryseolinea flava TaxID=2059302 RepID=A0A364Y3A3_9BACT|nr:glycoside hydrolase family 71/99-like protein [Pseudochryseolinea flava]RAW00626.1 hypothetical protein DQQ10_13620 [Pseudochryseolinea flava]
MKYLKLLALAALPLLFIHCGGGGDDGDEPKPEDTFKVKVLLPIKVAKTEEKKIYVHLMPWFESKETSVDGKWGQHWTMANRNPDVIEGGRRQIASHYYPLIGPYASSDKFVVEYQALLMKLAGIDGVVIDWYGTTSARDYPQNAINTEAFIAQTAKTGLEFALVYEDQSVKHAFNDKKITDKLAQGRADMAYLKSNHFSRSNYTFIDGKPLLMAFGPQEFQTEDAWSNVFSGLTTKPKFLTLWGESGEAGVNAGGEFAWIYQNESSSHTSFLDNFYNNEYEGLKMGSAYPGFKDYYQQGGWDNGYFLINHNGTGTLEATLNKALAAEVSHIQLATWNDYGEGTMIEPTVEFGYSLLTLLQSKLGSATSQEHLEMVAKLYALRVRFKDDKAKQKRLDQVFYYLVALQFADAKTLLDEVD